MILPYREWVLSGCNEGQLTATLRDNIAGTGEVSFFTQFIRGDAVRFRLHPSVQPGFYVNKGDTIGWIESRETELQLVQLNGELLSQKAFLTQAKSGEKESVIQEAQNRLEHAIEQVEEQKLIVKRTEDLYKTNFVPFQDYEIARNTLRLYEINVAIAQSQLLSVQTGVKQEEIEMISTQIANLEHEIDTLLDRLKDYTITCPITGLSFETFSADTLIVIGDVSRYAVKIPINLRIRDHVNQHQKVDFEIQGYNNLFHGSIQKIGNVATILRDEQVFVVTASMETNGQDPLAFTITRCSVICEPITLYEYLFRSINSVFNR